MELSKSEQQIFHTTTGKSDHKQQIFLAYLQELTSLWILTIETEVHKKEKFLGMYFMWSCPIIAASKSQLWWTLALQS